MRQPKEKSRYFTFLLYEDSAPKNYLELLSPSDHAKLNKLLARFDRDIKNYLIGSSRYAISYTIRQGQTVK